MWAASVKRLSAKTETKKNMATDNTRERQDNRYEGTVSMDIGEVLRGDNYEKKARAQRGEENPSGEEIQSRKDSQTRE